MQFSAMLKMLALAVMVPDTLGAPTRPKEKRDGEDDPVIVQLTSTVHDVQTNTHIVQGSPTTTKTHVNINTSTTTSTRYTATITSTVFGTPKTYTTVASTPLAEALNKPKDGAQSSSTPTSSSSDASSSSSSPASSQQNNGAAGTPTITGSNIPSSTGQWSITNVATTTSAGVCVVNYDYYDANDSVETVTSTKTKYHTVTKS